MSHEYPAHERTKVLLGIDEAHMGLSAAVGGLSETQSNFKPASGGWSIAQIVEHLAIVEDRILGRIHQLLSATAEAAAGSSVSVPDGELRKKIVDRTSKFQAPEAAHPTGRPMPESLNRLVGSRGKIADVLQSAPPDFKLRAMSHPVFGSLNCHQWLVTLGGHCTRHTQQIEEIKAAPDFPAR